MLLWQEMFVDHGHFKTFKAVHPDWTGHLRLSIIDDRMSHEGHASTGRYTLIGSVLTVYWDKYKADIFRKVSDAEQPGGIVFVHIDIGARIPALEQVNSVSLGKKTIAATRIAVVVPDSAYEVTLRLGNSDVSTFRQVFEWDEYVSPDLPPHADRIIDLGGNIGLGTVFFALRYPHAQILTVEPEAENFALLVGNTAALGDRVERRHAAVWSRDGSINLHTEGEDGASLDSWGVQVSDAVSAEGRMTRCFKLSTLMAQVGFDTVDILKVDIEGAELELFSQGAEAWLPRVRLIIVETHDRFRTGSEAAVRAAMSAMFDELPRSGENLIFRRR